MSLDDDDIELILWSWWPSGWVSAFILFAVVLILSVIVESNKEDCAAQRCPPGTSPKLTSHECLCVTRPQ